MATVTISPKFQVIIPKDIREKLKLTPGHKVETIMYENRIELIPVRSMQSMKGFLKGINSNIEHDRDRI